MSRRVKNATRVSTTEGSISIPGLTIGKGSSRMVIDVVEYSRHLRSIRMARESFPNLPLDEDFLRIAGHVFSSLTVEAKKDLSYILTGVDEIPVLRHQVGTNAVWFEPYFREYCRVYEETVRDRDPKKRLPYFRYSPIGARVVLSQYKGLVVYFTKRTKSIDYLTWDQPLRGNISIGNQKINPKEGGCVRVLAAEIEDHIWAMAFGSDDPAYFSMANAARDATEAAEADLIAFVSDRVVQNTTIDIGNKKAIALKLREIEEILSGEDGKA